MSNYYVMFIFSKKNMVGVRNKISYMSKEFEKENIKYLVFNRGFSGKSGSATFIDVDEFFWFFSGVFFRIFRYLPLFFWYKKNKGNVGNVILRYPLFDFSIFFLPSSLMKSIYTEHHTKELAEIKKLKIGFFSKQLQYFFEKYLAPFSLRKTKGIIAVTQDILCYQKARIGNDNKSGFVFSNGTDVNAFEVRKHNFIESRSVFSLVFVASKFMPWHGLDRLLKSLECYKGKRKIVVDVIGESDYQLPNLKHNVTVVFHGLLSSCEVSDILSKSTVACDSLALDRLGMNQSSTLKAKEYFSIGIPFFSNTVDVDLVLSGMEDSYRLFKKINIDNESFEFEDILDWYDSIEFSRCSDDVFSMRAYISWSNKIKSLSDHIKN